MSGEAWLYLLAVLINAVNLFLQVFFTIMYSDLEWYVWLANVVEHCVLLWSRGFQRWSSTVRREARNYFSSEEIC